MLFAVSAGLERERRSECFFEGGSFFNGLAEFPELSNLCLPVAIVFGTPEEMYFNWCVGIDSFTILVLQPRTSGVEGMATLAGGQNIASSGVAD